MELDGVAGEVLYPSQGLFYFKVADPLLMSAIFRAYNDWLAEFCRTDPARLKGIAMINLDDVEDGIKELERAARLGLAGAMITEYPLEHRRYDGSEYEPFWAAAAALAMPLSLHTATRRQGRIRGARLDRGYSAHSMRATFITTALENGAQLQDVQRAAGHRDPDTTKLYGRRGYNPKKAPSFFATY
jgi:Amidohydrolase